MRNFIIKLTSILFCLTFLFMHTELVYANNLPVKHFKDVEASFNTQNNKIEIYIKSKFQRNISIKLTTGSYKYILRSNISKLSFKNSNIHSVDLICIEKAAGHNRHFILKDVGRIKKIDNSNYNYRIYYKIPIRELNDNLDSSAIINLNILHPIKKGSITTISLSIPPWMSILISLVCVYLLNEFRLQRLTNKD